MIMCHAMQFLPPGALEFRTRHSCFPHTNALDLLGDQLVLLWVKVALSSSHTLSENKGLVMLSENA